MPPAQDTQTDPVVVDRSPFPATSHVAVIADRTRTLPWATRAWPLAPWRFVLVVTSLALAAVCGGPAAAPVTNGADLAVLISLGAFAVAFIPGRKS